MPFSYFAQPERFAAFLEAEQVCAGCQQTRRCLDATIFYGEESMHAICPDCLAGGALRRRNIFTCEGDVAELREQVQALHPDWLAADQEQVVSDKTEDLEKTTPPVISWQDWPWPCADGDYCTFVGYGSKAMYNRLATEQDGAALFALSLYHTIREEADADALWADYLPDAEIKDLAASQAFDTLFYVFKSRPTGRIVTVWDAA